MARVTVEDCILQIPNRFELVLLAAQRARDIAAGGALTLDRDNDKNPVCALREIADVTVSLDGLQNALIKGMQKHVEIDERYFRPAEVDHLCGDASKARAALGWQPTMSFRELIESMVDADVEDRRQPGAAPRAWTVAGRAALAP